MGMDVKKIFAEVGKIGLSAATHGVSDKVFDIIQNKGLSPQAKDELAKAKQASADELTQLEAKTASDQLAASASIVGAINDTMQAEAKSEHWMQWAWRPIWGIIGALLVFNNYILLPYCQGLGIRPIDVPDIVWQVILAVVGVSAFTRGLDKIASSWTGNK